ncbi:MFS transporter, partial [Williamsia sp.]|uniref:MFS transporter n=1 Tax=Williamsia sp. TaxID=1872085 RepID=UPI0025E4195D
MSTLEHHDTTVDDTGTRRRWLGFGGLAVASFLGCIDLTIVTTALPEITRGLDTDVATSQLTLGVFLMALAMFMVTAGRLADRYGRKKVLLIGLSLFVVASVGAALAGTIAALVIARFFQGAATATLYTSTSTLVESLFGEGERGRAIGLLYAINGVGLAAGPVLGALLVPTWGWPAIFWVNLPLGLLALVAIVIAVDESRAETSTGSDWAGQVALAVTVVAGIGVPVLGDIAGWLSLSVLASAVVFLGGLALTVVV